MRRARPFFTWTNKGELDIPHRVACCCVEIKGKDGKTHTLTTDATSAYDAVQKAAQIMVVTCRYGCDRQAQRRKLEYLGQEGD